MVDAGGYRLYSELSGEGDPLVLVHAGIVDSRVWDPQVAAFSPTHQVLRYDQPGFGRSEDLPRAMPLRAGLQVLMDHYDLGPAHIVGNSMGGTMVLDFALDNPDRLRSLVLIAPGLSGYEPTRAEMFEGPALISESFGAYGEAFEGGDIDALNELLLRVWVDGVGREGGDASVRRQVGEMNSDVIRRELARGEIEDVPLTPPAARRLDEIQVPVLVVVGEHDLPVTHRVAGLLVDGISNAELSVVPATAHLPSLENPELFNRLLRDFLAQV